MFDFSDNFRQANEKALRMTCMKLKYDFAVTMWKSAIDTVEKHLSFAVYAAF